MLSSFSQKGMIEGEHMQEWFDSVGKKFVLAFVEGDRWKLYFKGLGVTLEIALFAAILGMVIGTVVALMRLSQKRNGKKTIWARIAGIYVDVIRGTPSVLQLLIMWFIVMKNSQNGVLVASLSLESTVEPMFQKLSVQESLPWTRDRQRQEEASGFPRHRP